MATPDVTELLLAWGRGEESALEKLMPVVYQELRRMARGQARKLRVPNWTEFSNRDHEFLLTLGVNREWGATGASRIAASKGATEPRLYFGKGLGDLDIGYLRPLAVPGFIGYLSADARPRPDLVKAGFAVQYSIPYLLSKVQSFNLPPLIRGLTPAP